MATTPRFATLANGLEIAYESKANLDILQREIFTDYLYGRHGIQFREGDCIFDVGANLGFFLLRLNQLLSNARVLAFEPIPATFELLKLNADRHNKLTLELFNCGLSDTAGEATFTHYPLTSVASTMCPQDSAEFRRNSRRFVLEEIKERGGLLRGLASVTPGWLWFPLTETIRRIYQRAVRVNCKLDTLSGVIERLGIERIDVLKIDTEGAEHAVLAGLRDEHWPLVRQIIVEVHDGMPGLESVLSVLTRHNFRATHEKPLPNVDHLYVVYAKRPD